MSHILIMIPTYNERGNIPTLVDRILAIKQIDADLLFVDDNSPDGTGNVIDHYVKKYDRVKVLHRQFKAGVGTAHQAGIEWAYKNNYTHLVTMDGDFTHSPEDIIKLLEYSGTYDVVMGGRYSNKDSLAGWAEWRKFLSHLGHQFTTRLLHLNFDATTGFRIYRIDIIPLTTFQLIKSKSYSFFIESICILNENKFTMHDVPVIFPPRSVGTSKLKFKDMVDWLLTVLRLGLQIRIHSSYLYDPTFTRIIPER